jgi:YfiH family protein
VPAVPALCVPTAGGPAHVRCSTRNDGDLNADEVAPAVLAQRWAALAGRPVTWLDEDHGVHVVDVTAPGEHTGVTADGAVTDRAGVAIGIWVGDCAPVAFVSDEGHVGAAHAGWRGLLGGVLGRTVDAMRAKGATGIRAVLGPCIRAECYEFGAGDLDRMATRFGPAVRGTTRWGTPALDVPAAVHAALAADGVPVHDVGVCTACDGDHYWSHRARADRGRQGLVVWRDTP